MCNNMLQLDNLDKRIMYELDLDARIPASKLAKKLLKSKETINFRINRIIQNKVLKGFYTIFNNSKLGWYYYKVYIKFKNTTPEKEKEIFDFIQSRNHIAYLGSVEGYFDCIFLVMIKTPKEMSNFMNPFMKQYGEFVQEKEVHTVLTTHRLNQKFLYKGEISRDLSYGEDIENFKLDEIEKKILNIISNNARIPLVDIAEKIKVDHKLVKYRLNKLEREKIILGYTTSPNFDEIGLQFTQINISLKDPSVKASMISYFNFTNKCLFVLELLGRYDLSLEIHVENNQELKKIIDEFKKQFVNKYNDYDVSTITKEYVMVWIHFLQNN